MVVVSVANSTLEPDGQRKQYMLRVDPSGDVEILVEQAVAAKDIDIEVAKKDLSAAEADLAKWGDKPQDGDYQNLRTRAGWAKARLDTVGH